MKEKDHSLKLFIESDIVVLLPDVQYVKRNLLEMNVTVLLDVARANYYRRCVRYSSGDYKTVAVYAAAFFVT